MSELLHKKCKTLIGAFRSGALGQTVMPEDSNPGFTEDEREMRIAYFTLPMALNYQRDSYKLWEAALKTYEDPETSFVFDINMVCEASEDEVRRALTKHKVALQPNKHVSTWRTIARTVLDKWGSFEILIDASGGNFVRLRDMVRIEHKKGFPYLSGPKIFNYWSFILGAYAGVELTSREHIDIAPDTHITQCSVRLGVLTQEEAMSLGKDEVSERWRVLLSGSGIDPIDMHPPLWFWSRNGFIFSLE